MNITTQTYWRIASALSIGMYGANFHQAYLNIYVGKWSVVLPLFGLVAATCRCLYVRFDPKSPITRSNSVWIIWSATSIITYFFF